MPLNRDEELTGYVVDLACLRKYPQDETLERARVHTRACAVMPHCVESGYGVVTADGRVVPLDVHATPLIYQALQRSDRERGIKVTAKRRRDDEEMKTVALNVGSA